MKHVLRGDIWPQPDVDLTAIQSGFT